MVETGENLRNTREVSGISLEEVSKDLNIPVITLEQIEAGSYGASDDIYAARKIVLDYSKYLGLNTAVVLNKFNEYMFGCTSKISLDEIEKIVREKMKDEDDEDRICSPYTKSVEVEKPLPYIIAGIIIFILVIVAIVWSIIQISIIKNGTTNVFYKIVEIREEL